jgi:hypothetical protein
MEIENIIYETTRGIYSVEDKLSIATVFIFCWKMNSKLFAELLYCNDHVEFIDNLNAEYKDYEVDFSIRLADKNVKDCFYKTLEKVKEKYDDNGFFKALFEGDEFALVIAEIQNYNFDAFQIKKLTKNMAVQLSLEF